MPTLREDFEIAEGPSFQIENWRVEQQKERPYRKEPEGGLWKFQYRLNRLETIGNSLLELISDSNRILTFQGDPEDDKFIPYSKETLDRAVALLRGYVNLARVSGAAVPLPKLLPGPAGSIDIHWKTAKKELLVNIPSDQKAPALFYGDDYGQLCIEGKLATTSLHPAIAAWLLNW